MSVGQMIVSSFGDAADKVWKGSGKFAKAALSIDPLDFIQIKPSINKDGNKRVVLVFDDLERSKLDTVDILGCINDYCENQNFLVIIVVHEDKVNKGGQATETTHVTAIELEGHDNSETGSSQSKKDEKKNVNLKFAFEKKKNTEGISYDEIKEKIVCRTVIYEPDYSQIISSIINAKDSGLGIEYLGFLKRNKERIIELLDYDVDVDDDSNENDSEQGTVIRPRNIRSLKCALHDFQRVYNILKEEVSDSEVNDNLIAFVAYVLAAKANLLHKSDRYGYLFTNSAFRNLYPFVNDSSLYRAEEDWVLCNSWDKDYLRQEIEDRKELARSQKAAKEPKEILRVNRIFDVDDEDIKKGFPLLLEDCYSGKLDFNDYVQFICNAMNMRMYQFPQYEQIKWDQVLEGVNTVIENIKQSRDYDEAYNRNHFHKWIEDDFREKFDPCELKPYDEISRFIDEGGINFEKNRQNYLDATKDNSIRAIALSENKRFDRFDKEMAAATYDCYKSCTQVDRNTFPQYFTGVWSSLDKEKWFQADETVNGLTCLEELLNKLRDEYINDEKIIAKISLEVFLKEVTRLKDKYVAIALKDNGVEDNLESQIFLE